MVALLQDPLPFVDNSANWFFLLLALVGEVLAFVFVARVLMRGGAPASTLLWVVVILLTPWIGLALYYLFPRQLQLRRLKRMRARQQRWRGLRPARSSDDSEPLPGDALPEPASADGSRAQPEDMVRLLGRIVPNGLSGGNDVHWLPGARDFFTEAERAIAEAESFVHLEVYIFRPDETGLRFLQVLTEAARRGIEVRLLFDSFGSLSLKAHLLADLRAAGGKAVAFLPLFWKRRPFTVNLRNHRKLLVVDGKVAFVGGRNIGDEYATGKFGQESRWHDAMAAVRGPAVADLHHVFAEDWYNASDEELTDARYFPVVASRSNDLVAVVGSGPDRDLQELWFAIFQAVGGARTSIDLSSPYLVPPPSLVFALRVAAARGVRVRIFTNGKASEAFVLYHAQSSYYEELVGSGIEVYETVADYNHTKVMVIDGRTVMIGSSNLDLRSAHLNFEIAIVMPDSERMAQAILETLDRRAQHCAGAVPKNRTIARRIVDGACRLLSPLL